MASVYYSGCLERSGLFFSNLHYKRARVCSHRLSAV